VLRFSQHDDLEGMTVKRIRGSDLPPRLQTEAKALFVHRCTGEHIPAWALRGHASGPYKVQFADDAEWLAHTFFFVTERGEIARRPKHCESYPTWRGGLVAVRASGD